MPGVPAKKRGDKKVDRLKKKGGDKKVGSLGFGKLWPQDKILRFSLREPKVESLSSFANRKI